MSAACRSVVDEPVGTLGGLTHRATVKTKDGPDQVAEWLKLLENMTAKSGDGSGAMQLQLRLDVGGIGSGRSGEERQSLFIMT
ncbi:hypothetical protein [Bradyrhizobium guangzhouense]|uniref:hypothetical protein n=1 Tax=Bradyrhizobium guangzhouense TaxID=1325095 RepID=UPI001009F462|nr:hypothetical protein [Bradyrhizobium guangzhouense]RXH12468.1 hypothetical protein EAS54_26340 [Bradyrhizobium guangzhouense]